jgi:hypothetical protein
MIICPVCKYNNDIHQSQSFCQSCRWPLRFDDEKFMDPAVKKMTIEWAQNSHNNTLLSKPEVSSVSASRMNEVLKEEPFQSCVELRTEVKELRNRLDSFIGEQGHKVDNFSRKVNAIETFNQKTADNFKKIESFLRNLPSTRVGDDGFLAKEKLTNASQKTSHDQRKQETANNLLTTSTPDSSIPPEESEFVNEYKLLSHDVPNSWDAIKVATDSDSVNRLRNGSDSSIIFNKDQKGIYIIVQKKGYLYLVPSKFKKILSHQFNIIQAIYECDGHSEFSQSFELVRPALVSEESGNWRLSQKGILQFT